MTRALLLAALALGALAPAAQANVIITVVGNELRATSNSPAEANDLRVILDDAGEDLEFYDDSGATVINQAPGTYCAQNAGSPTNDVTDAVRCDYDNTAALDLVIDLKDGTNEAQVSRKPNPTGVIRYVGGAGCDKYSGTGTDRAQFVSLGGDPGASCSQTAAGGLGRDEITGGPLNDVLFANAGGGILDGGAGDDQLTGGADGDDLRGGDGEDVLKGVAGNDLLSGGANDDQLLGGDGDDSADGGAGIDSVSGENGNDPDLRGGDNDDSVSGGPGDDGIFGDFGDDFLDPGEGTDHAHGGPGDDAITDTPGADLIDGGEGTIDAIAYGAYAPDGPVFLSLDGVANDGRSGEGDNLVAMETLTGGPQADVITGDAGVNYLNGGDGNDQIDGGLGIDILRGNLGDDTVSGRDNQLQRDDMGCNEGAGDVAVADANDRVASDCETLDRAPPPPGVDPATLSPAGTAPPASSGPGSAPGGAAGGPLDQTAPAITLRGVPARISKTDLRRKGVTISIGVSEAAALEVRLLGKPSRATIAAVGDLVLGETLVRHGSGTRQVRVRPARALLGRGSKFKLRLVVVAIDSAGNRRTVTRTIRVAPKKRR